MQRCLFSCNFTIWLWVYGTLILYTLIIKNNTNCIHSSAHQHSCVTSPTQTQSNTTCHYLSIVSDASFPPETFPFSLVSLNANTSNSCAKTIVPITTFLSSSILHWCTFRPIFRVHAYITLPSSSVSCLLIGRASQIPHTVTFCHLLQNAGNIWW